MNHLRYIPYAFYSFLIFKTPLTFLKIQSGVGNQSDIVKTWSGLTIPVWGREDTSSLSVIFLKSEYGRTGSKDVVLDVGANKGYFSLMAAEAGSTVYTFEPDQKTFAHLKEVMKCNEAVSSRITPYSKGLASNSGKRTFFHHPESSISSSMVFSSEATEETVIECITVKEIVRENNIKSIDVFKIDAEGAEYEIFYTMDDEIFSLIKEIRMEYHNDTLNKENTISSLQPFIESKGFSTIKLEKAGDGCGIVWFKRV